VRLRGGPIEATELVLDHAEPTLHISEPPGASERNAVIGCVANDRRLSMHHKERGEIACLADVQKLIGRDGARPAFHPLDCREGKLQTIRKLLLRHVRIVTRRADSRGCLASVILRPILWRRAGLV
jgi:hypothetical protein